MIESSRAMKTNSRYFLPAVALLLAGKCAFAACHCGVAPERADDFFWENELVGFRAYGPGDKHNWSGIDVFSKLPDAAITCGELLHNHVKCGNWHVTPYKGILDDYAVGPGRGVGGVALRKDGKWLADYGNWKESRIIADTPGYCAFELDYALPIGGTMTLSIDISSGRQFFTEIVSFSDDVPVEGLEVGVGIDLAPEREHAGDVFTDSEKCIVSLFENPHAREGAMVSRMSAVYALPGFGKTSLVDGPDGSKLVMTAPLKAGHRGPALVVCAGADGTECGRFATAAGWHAYVRTQCGGCAAERARIFQILLERKHKEQTK